MSIIRVYARQLPADREQFGFDKYDHPEEWEVAGKFDTDTAEHWDGEIDVFAGTSRLWRTAEGRWVLKRGRWVAYATPSEARAWLCAYGYDYVIRDRSL